MHRQEPPHGDLIEALQQLDTSDSLELIEQTREEAYRLFNVHRSEGRVSSPQDEWIEAWALITRRRRAPHA